MSVNLFPDRQLDLIRIDPDTFRIVLAAQLDGKSYQELANEELRKPESPSDWPSKVWLKERYKNVQMQAD